MITRWTRTLCASTPCKIPVINSYVRCDFHDMPLSRITDGTPQNRPTATATASLVCRRPFKTALDFLQDLDCQY